MVLTQRKHLEKYRKINAGFIVVRITDQGRSPLQEPWVEDLDEVTKLVRNGVGMLSHLKAYRF